MYFLLVELGSELLSAVVKAGVRKHCIGEENFFVELAGGSDPSLKVGLQLRGGANGFPFLGLLHLVSWAATVPLPQLTVEKQGPLSPAVISQKQRVLGLRSCSCL